jgi:hypothetical protein
MRRTPRVSGPTPRVSKPTPRVSDTTPRVSDRTPQYKTQLRGVRVSVCSAHWCASAVQRITQDFSGSVFSFSPTNLTTNFAFIPSTSHAILVRDGPSAQCYAYFATCRPPFYALILVGQLVDRCCDEIRSFYNQFTPNQLAVLA